jgi:hypothetical protein
MKIWGEPLVRDNGASFVPCDHCTMDTRDGCTSWDHVRVSDMVVLRLQDALRGRIVDRWILELLAAEFFADSSSFDVDRFLASCGATS